MNDRHEHHKTPDIPKAVQYADEILEGKYTFDSLKGQLPESWIQAVQQELELRGFLVLPEKGSESIEESHLSPEKISAMINEARQEFSDETDSKVATADALGVPVNPEIVEEVKQETQFNEHVTDLKKEAEQAFENLEKNTLEQNGQNLEKNITDLTEYFINATRPTVDWKYKPDLSGEGELALRENFDHLLELGAGEIQAHGIAKGSIGEQFNNLLSLLTHGVDERGNHSLYTAPLVVDPEFAPGAGVALGTGGGTAYLDGSFIVLAKKGVHTIEHRDDIGGILVNEAVAETLPDFVEKLKIAFPHLAIDSYSNAPKVIQDLTRSHSEDSKLVT